MNEPTRIFTGRSTIRMYNCDCMELLESGKKWDLAIVDPPYGIGEDGQRNITGDRPTAKWKNPKSHHYKTFDDSEIPNKKYFKKLFRVSKNQIVFGGNYFTKYLPPSKGWIVWDKQVDIKEHLSMCELAWSSFNKKCNKYEYLWAGFKKKHQIIRQHPTQKPVQLYKWLLHNYAEQGQTILDTHGGSMSIAIACWDLGFDLDICELDTDYFNQAVKRFENHIAQQTLF